MRIAVDVDGVLLDIMVRYCEIFNEIYGTVYTKEDVAHWEFFHEWDVSEEMAYEIFYKIYENSQKVPFIDINALKILKTLHKKYHVDIVSARTSKFKKSLKEALKSHGIVEGSHYNNLIVVKNKPYDLKLNLNYDIYVDDNPNLVYPIKKTPKKVLLLYSQPWNENSKLAANVIRVNNWEEIEEIFRDLDDKNLLDESTK